MKRWISLYDEAKQVGILYHFTTDISLLGILSRNILDIGTLPYVSFTRNKNFLRAYRHKLAMGLYDISSCLVIDGDKLSNNYKIEPYNYYGHYDKNNRDEFSIETRDEQEEIVKKPIDNILRYIVKIIIFKNKFDAKDARLLRWIKTFTGKNFKKITFEQYIDLIKEYSKNILVEIK